MSEDVYTKYPQMEQVASRIKKHEGYRLLPYELKYKQSDGKYVKENFKTGGYGHVIQAGETIPDTKEGWENIFQNDISKAVKSTEQLLDSSKVDPAAFGVVTEMVYQIGATGVSKFKKTLEHLNNGDYENASKEMLKSKWAIQTPDRAVSLADIVKGISK